MDANGDPSITSSCPAAPGWRIDRSSIFREPQALQGDTTCDTAIIGGGIVGLSLAYHLSNRQRVVVLESKELGSASSGWNAGVMSLSTTLDLAVLGDTIGREQAEILAALLTNTLDQFRDSLSLERDIWQSGRSMFAAAKKPHEQLLQHEHEVQSAYGFKSNMIPQRELASFWKGFPSALSLNHEHAVHPYRLVLSLAKAVEKQGTRLFENSPAGKWTADDDGVTIAVNGFKVRANNLVVATGVAGLGKLFDKRINRKSIAVTGQVLVTKPTANVRDLIAETGTVALWDTLKFYHYIHYLPDGRMLVGGADSPGQGRSTEVDITGDASLKRLHNWAAKHHRFAVPEVESAWRASFIYPLDGLPLIATQHNGRVIHAVTDGLPFGILVGKVLANLLTGTDNELTDKVIGILTERQNTPGAEKLVAMLPDNAAVRNLAVRIGMIGLKLHDLVL